MFKSALKPFILLFIPMLMFSVGCQAEQKQKPALETLEQKASYGIGLDFGAQMTDGNLGLDLDALMQGVEDGFKGGEAMLTDEQLAEVKETFIKKLQAKQESEAKALTENNKVEGETFLADNAKKDGVITLESGLQYKVLTPGTGKSPAADGKVKVHYRGTLIDGTEFDSSYKRDTPAEFPVNGLIAAWQEALPMMKEGGKWQLFVPAELGYGERGAGGVIGPNQALIFEMELLEVL